MCYINGLNFSPAEFIWDLENEKSLKALNITDSPSVKGFSYGPGIKTSVDGNDRDVVLMEWVSSILFKRCRYGT